MAKSKSEAWRKVVLRGMPAPAWQDRGAEEDGIVVSCRSRAARNVRGFRFPHHASNEDLRTIARAFNQVFSQSQKPLEMMHRLSEAERDYLLGSRLVSADFDHRGQGRFVVLDQRRVLSVMINEEDHMRAQALTPGWSLREAIHACEDIVEEVGNQLEFAEMPGRGILTASPSNAGSGTRYSALFHLLGLAQSGRLPSVIRALSTWGLVARGLFGETSRAVGAFFQVSTTNGRSDEFVGACDFLIGEEKAARKTKDKSAYAEALVDAARAGSVAPTLALSDAIKILSWVRWGATDPEVAAAVEFDHRDVDGWIAQLEVHGTTDPSVAARHRAEFCRSRLEHVIGVL